MWTEWIVIAGAGRMDWRRQVFPQEECWAPGMAGHKNCDVASEAAVCLIADSYRVVVEYWDIAEVVPGFVGFGSEESTGR
jgi:hypothetical protein